MSMTRLDVPVGTVIDYAGSTIPDGYLECDGSAVSRTAYPALFAAIGTTWGAGNGSTTFNLPNLGGRACIGKGTRSVGDTGGSETHTLTEQELPSHKHQIPQHGHGFTSPTVSSSGYVANGIPGNGSHSHNSVNKLYYESGWSAHVVSGGDGYISVTSPTIQSTTTDGWHQHDLPNHTHALTGGGVSDKAAFDTNSTGSGSAHSIMQPYAVLRKVIRAA